MRNVSSLSGKVLSMDSTRRTALRATKEMAMPVRERRKMRKYVDAMAVRTRAN